MRSGEAGFTILEALVAFAILSVVLVALYAGASNSLGAVERGAQSHHIALLAQSKLDEFAATRYVLPASVFGVFPGTRITWTAQTSDLPGSTAGRAAIMLQDVALTLEWPDGLVRRSVTFRTRHLGTVRR
jgi:Tfp pilus assembly protein PilV